MNISTEVPKVLRRAADLIEKHGWWQDGRDGISYPGKRCVMIAVSDACDENGDLDFRIRDTENASQTIKEYLGITNVFHWNDAPERTAEEVVNVLRVVAALHDTESVPGVVPAPDGMPA